MKRVLLRTVFLAVCLMMLSGSALAQNVLRVYVGEGAMEDGMVRRLTALLKERFEQAEFVLEDGEDGLRQLVLDDRAPNLAICSPREVYAWAKEGLTLPLQQHIGGQEDVARELLSSCVQDEVLFMAPLTAQHRQMAINVKMIEKHAMGYMLDEIAHPVWYPTEFQQILEEFAIADAPAMDIWKMQPQDCAAIEALLQAIYCGRLLDEDGMTCMADEKDFQAGLRWLRDLVNGGMIGKLETRQDALDRFLAGETAVFLDWSRQMQEKYAKQLREAGITVEMRPYPSSSGLPVRAYELTGVSVFDCGDAGDNALALQAAVFLHEDESAQAILGERGIFDDGSVWLWDLAANNRGTTLRSLLCDAAERVLAGEEDVVQALEMVKAGMNMAQ